MIDPVLLIQGLSNWIYRTHTMDIAGYGPVYLAAAVLLVTACVSLLVLRYRRLTV